MWLLKGTIAALAGSSMIASVAVAHPGHEHELGIVHVMTSLEHVAAFLVFGAAAAVLMLTRRIAVVAAANLALLFYILVQGVVHGMHGGALFGVETALAGAALALGSWRATHLVYQRWISRQSTDRR